MHIKFDPEKTYPDRPGLRNYQSFLYSGTRTCLSKHRAVCVQLFTGGGKTPLAAAMCDSVYVKKKRAWFVAPRRDLVNQTSNQLRKWNVPHAKIDAKNKESRAFKIHVVSSDTLIRRLDKIKNWPDALFFDECHINLDRQLEIAELLPVTSKIIGLTATHERLDGRGLNELYPSLVEGPSIPWGMRHDFLSDLKYFAPVLEGLENLNKRGTDLDAEQLEDLLKRRKVYGDVVGYYEKYAKIRKTSISLPGIPIVKTNQNYNKALPGLFFTRSVKAAYDLAERFRDKGFNFHCLEGRMSDKKRRNLIQAHTNGEIDGLTNCEIATYGLDIPRIEYGGSIRPTLSRSLYFQKIGRLIRPFEDKITGYKKQFAYFFDHVNLVLEHQEPDFPGVPPHYLENIEWNFTGTEKRKRNKSVTNIKSCPHLDFLYCQKPTCSTCEHNPDKSVTDARKPMVVIDADLEEKVKPISLAARPPEEKREFQDRINAAALEYKTEMSPGAVGEMLKIADECGYSVFWVYHRLTESDRHTINIPLLSEIARQKDFKPGWVWFAKNKIKQSGGNKQEAVG